MRSQLGEIFVVVHRAGVAGMRIVVALGFEAPTSNSAREVGSRISARDRSRSQTPIPTESARDRRVACKKKKRSLSLRLLRATN